MGIIKTEFREITTITLFPYKEVDEFPSYPDENGNKVPLDEGWREVGFKVPIPTLKVAQMLQNKATTVRQSKSADTKQFFQYTETDLLKAAKYMTHEGFIRGWVGVGGEDSMGDTDYDPDWLLKNFNAYPFLFGKLFNEYLALVKQAEDEEVKDDENFPEI